MSNKANRDDLARLASQLSEYKYSKKEIEEMIDLLEHSVGYLIEEGFDEIKIHKFLKILVADRKPKRAYDGINNRYYDDPAKKYLKFKPMKILEDAIEKRNEEGK